MTQPTTYGMSVNIYGRGDASLGDGPSHMGIAVYQVGSPTCNMYHIRNPNDTDFIYDPREQPLEDPVLRGRCELATFSTEQKAKIAQLLTAFGEDGENIPEFGVGNCQDWVASAITMLESAGEVKSGEGDFWKSMINKSADQMRESCIARGRTWIKGADLTFEGEPDARFSDQHDARPVGKLAQNALFQQRMRSLLGAGSTANASKPESQPAERPFYISSPFFSQTNNRN
ncbi:hypothetical protein BDV25DRAFT_148957 [Aspergillus avenaceus]|uniref:Uncharacterized protein n=1 Tax=Aspergillus avenaceus TaxID=36643 RepID=A0A5N6U545_ASPAV|nr:hypothetical protein BDV25DRAFT_148957 [Aspergillus avenaceus]